MDLAELRQEEAITQIVWSILFAKFIGLKALSGSIVFASPISSCAFPFVTSVHTLCCRHRHCRVSLPYNYIVCLFVRRVTFDVN